MIKKANKRLFILRSLKKFGFDQNELAIVYKSYVRPVVEYADVVWHSGLTFKQAGDIERIQRRACRTILGHQFISYTNALEMCDIIKLCDRRVAHCLKFAKGLSDNERTHHLMPPSRHAVHGRNLRNSTQLTQFRTKTNRFKQSPIPYFVSLLNAQ